jgi:hypothetical protein
MLKIPKTIFEKKKMDKKCPKNEKNKNTFENRQLFDISRFL